MMTVRLSLLQWAGATASAVVLTLLAFTQPAFAGMEEGRVKAQTCFACHGAGGNSTIPLIPSLAGQPKNFLMLQLFQFREGKRKNDQMSPFAANLTNADLTDLATFFSAQSITPTPVITSPANVEAGKRLAAQNNCISCHSANLMGQAQIPRIAGQQKEYLRAQLRGFKASTRFDPEGDMTSAAQALSQEDIEVLADYLAGLPTSH